MTPKVRVLLLKLAVWVGASAPLGWGLYRWFFGDRLGANPVEVMIRSSGFASVVILIASLAITPVRQLTGWNDLQKVRRLAGLWAFAYAALHLSVYLYLDQALAWGFIIEDVTERPFIAVGSMTFALLLPLAVTSTRGWIRRLGRNWTRLHWLVYPASLLGLLHYGWGQKADLRGPIVWGTILVALLGYRVWKRRQKSQGGRTGAAAARAAGVAVLAAVLSSCASAGGGPHGGMIPAASAGEMPAGHGSGESPEERVARLTAAPDEGVEFAVFTGEGERVELDAVIQAMAGADVLFFGEEHNDQTAHRLQTEILRRLFSSWAVPAREGAAPQRSLVLSLEMFETDVQYVVDEYLAGLISESHFLSSSRPWDQYEVRYRPAVEFARVHGIPVVAANAPRRYVNRASRLGRESLAEMPASALEHLPPLPYPEASDAYQAEWDALMGPMAQHMQGNPLDAQTLWDASMAWRVGEAVDAADAALVLHFVGSFHVKNGTGTPEALAHYRPDARAIVLVATPADDLGSLPAEHLGSGDFVVLTRPTHGAQ